MAKHVRPAVLTVGAALVVALPSTLAVSGADVPWILAASAALAAILAIFAGYWRETLIELIKKDRSQDIAVRNGCVSISGQRARSKAAVIAGFERVMRRHLPAIGDGTAGEGGVAVSEF